jgi:hypothetical protein
VNPKQSIAACLLIKSSIGSPFCPCTKIKFANRTMAKLHTNPTVAACKLTIPAPYDVWLCGWQFPDSGEYILTLPWDHVPILTHLFQQVDRRLSADCVGTVRNFRIVGGR